MKKDRSHNAPSVITKKRAQKFAGVCALLLVGYFGAYFLSVRASIVTIEASVFAVPVYQPVDSDIIQSMFTPAHLLDAAYLRPALWEAKIKG